MKKSIIFILAICFSIVSCKKIIDSAASLNKEEISAKDLVEVTINDDYSISIPDYMKEMKSLNDDASFQYANIYKETYTIVIDEDKQEFIDAFKEVGIYNDSLSVLENYSEFQVQSFQESLNSDEVKELDFNLKNLRTKQFELDGLIDGIHASYLIGFVESNSRMYMLMSWTVDDRYKKYKTTFQLIQNSFKIKK